jgi:hypothetical protein
MRREAERASHRTGLPIGVVEITGDTALEARYGTEVPVLVMPGGETLRGRTPPGEVEAAFRRAAGTLFALSPQADMPGRATRRGARLLGDLMSILGWRRRPQA